MFCVMCCINTAIVHHLDTSVGLYSLKYSTYGTWFKFIMKLIIVCMRVYVYVCIYVCMYVYMCVCVCVYIDICTYVYVCMYVHDECTYFCI